MFLHHIAGAFLYQGFEIDAVDDIEWIEHIAFGFGHFLSIGISDQAVNVHFLKWNLSIHKLNAKHNHAGDPEKYDVKAGDENTGWIPGF